MYGTCRYSYVKKGARKKIRNIREKNEKKKKKKKEIKKKNGEKKKKKKMDEKVVLVRPQLLTFTLLRT